MFEISIGMYLCKKVYKYIKYYFLKEICKNEKLNINIIIDIFLHLYKIGLLKHINIL